MICVWYVCVPVSGVAGSPRKRRPPVDGRLAGLAAGRLGIVVGLYAGAADTFAGFAAPKSKYVFAFWLRSLFGPSYSNRKPRFTVRFVNGFQSSCIHSAM